MKIINIKSTYLLLIAFIFIGNPSNLVYSQSIENKIDSLLALRSFYFEKVVIKSENKL